MPDPVPVAKIKIIQGESYHEEITVLNQSGTPFNLIGMAVRSHLRVVERSPDLIIAFTCAVTDGVNGKMERNLTATQTAGLSLPSMRHDAEAEDAAGEVVRVVKGPVGLDLEVTHP